MFNLNQFDFSKIELNNTDQNKYQHLKLTNKDFEEEKESEGRQKKTEERLREWTHVECQKDNSAWSPVKSCNKNNKSTTSNRNEALPHDIANKVLVFGGWKPYENLREIEIFDIKENKMEDILPFSKKYLESTK